MEALGFVPPEGSRRRRRGVDAPAVAAAAAGPPLRVREVTGPAVSILRPEDALQGAGGHPDTDLWTPSLFWEPPPIRLFVLCAA